VREQGYQARKSTRRGVCGGEEAVQGGQEEVAVERKEWFAAGEGIVHLHAGQARILMRRSVHGSDEEVFAGAEHVVRLLHGRVDSVQKHEKAFVVADHVARYLASFRSDACSPLAYFPVVC
jgi:hypothetical protein